jgi:hypothetical protein
MPTTILSGTEVRAISKATLRSLDRFLYSAPAILLTLLGLYVLMFQRYRAYEIDTPWFLSYSWNYQHSSVQTDEFGGAHFPQGMDGTRLFGKIPANLQCLLLDRTGWMPFPATMLSTVFTVASLALWWFALRKMGLSPRLIGIFILLLGLTEPVLGMAEKSRYEFWTFFLASLGLLIGLYGFEFAALAVSFIGVEAEPIAVAAVLGVATVLFVRSSSRPRLLAKFVAAALAGAGLYVALHPHALDELLHTPPGREFPIGIIFLVHFWERKRHLVDLVVLTIGVALYLRRGRAIPYPEIAWAATVVMVALALPPHIHVSYMVFLMPFLLLTALLGYEHSPHLAWLPALLGVALLAGYGYLAWKNRNEGYRVSDIQRVSAALHEAESRFHYDDDKLRIVGDASLWYAHPNNYFASNTTVRSTPMGVRSLQMGDFYLCYPGKLQEGSLSVVGIVTCSMLQQSIPLTLVQSMQVGNHTLYLYRHVH